MASVRVDPHSVGMIPGEKRDTMATLMEAAQYLKHANVQLTAITESHVMFTLLHRAIESSKE